MEKIHFKKFINAPVEKVWNAMLEDKTYREWTKPFHPSSYFKGSWEKGSEIFFLNEEDDTGMYSKIADNIPHKYISIQHLGIVKDDVKDTTSDEVKKWAPAFENYTFEEKDGGTEVSVDMDINSEYKKMFEEMWPKALEKLKEISEK